MSYFIRILCRSKVGLTTAELKSFVDEGAYFDSAKIDFGNSAVGAILVRCEIQYDREKRPIVIDNTQSDLFIRQELEELNEVVNDLAENKSIVKEHLQNTLGIIAIELDQLGLSGDAWEMLDCLEKLIATKYQGIVYAPGDGFYDHNLQMIAAAPD